MELENWTITDLKKEQKELWEEVYILTDAFAQEIDVHMYGLPHNEEQMHEIIEKLQKDFNITRK